MAPTPPSPKRFSRSVSTCKRHPGAGQPRRPLDKATAPSKPKRLRSKCSIVKGFLGPAAAGSKTSAKVAAAAGPSWQLHRSSISRVLPAKAEPSSCTSICSLPSNCSWRSGSCNNCGAALALTEHNDKSNSCKAPTSVLSASASARAAASGSWSFCRKFKVVRRQPTKVEQNVCHPSEVTIFRFERSNSCKKPKATTLEMA
mmetsp:Transcript_52494/g.114588  ORF Transcript_52494/g.114588 Transcript_52494/m.114588 type:complete len:201 (-) Transcript_52494:278-880(-)